VAVLADLKHFHLLDNLLSPMFQNACSQWVHTTQINMSRDHLTAYAVKSVFTDGAQHLSDGTCKFLGKRTALLRGSEVHFLNQLANSVLFNFE